MKELNSHDHSSRMAELVLKHLRNETNQRENEELEQWLAQDEKNRQFLQSLESELAHAPDLEFFSTLDTASAWENVARATVHAGKKKPSVLAGKVWRYAAVITILLGLALVPYLLQRNANVPTVAHKNQKHNQEQQILPGTDKAKLELADGSIIWLDQTADGNLHSEEGTLISKESGVVSYTAQQIGQASGTAFNKISTPKGGQFQILLSDGTRVWLNAESSLRFPTAFTGNERLIEMTGEAYFEVSPDKKRPFRVSTKGTTVQVLGTKFNIMAYDNEPALTTTLLEGAVRVSNGLQSKIMVPNQQALISGESIQLQEVDPEESVAWKNGHFHFQHTSLEKVMRQMERWYDIEVNYANSPEKHFTGVISRKTDIQKLLKMLETTGDIQFKIEGNKITASQKAL